MFSTGFLKVKTQILQTIFAELPQTAKKVKLAIKFDDQEKLSTFKRLEAERKEVEEDCASINSESDSQQDQQSVSEHSQKKGEAQMKGNENKLEIKKEANQRLRIQKINIGLEQGIIYKQFYEKQFSKIGEGLKVRINIRAQKITFQGYDIEDIEDAMVQVNELRQHIEIEYIPKYGLEMSESQMIRRKLENMGVKIFRILDKYYRWYEISPTLSIETQKEKRRDIKRILNEIDKSNHCLQYLCSIQQDIDTYKGSLNNDFQKLRMKFLYYRPLLEQLKGRVFVNELMNKINGQVQQDELEAELSISKDSIVFHAIAKELLEMTIKQVRVQFEAYEYFFLTIDSDQPIQKAIELLSSYEYQAVMESSKSRSVVGEIQEVKDINYIHFITNYEQVKQNVQSRINDPTFYGEFPPKENVIFCIAFRKKYPEYKLDYLSEIFSKLHAIWTGSSFKFSIFLDQEEQIEDNKVSYEFNQNQKLFTISANENSLDTNLLILKNYIIKRKLESLRNKQKNEENEENNVSISLINKSDIINDSTLFHDKSMTQDLNSSVLDGLKNQNLQNQLNITSQLKDQDIKSVQFLKDYSVFLAETSKEYNEKYKDNQAKQNQIVSTNKRNRSLEEQLTKISDSLFQVFKINLNQTHKIDSFYENPTRDEIVTVFVSSRISPFVKPKSIGLKIEEGINDTIPVRLLTLRQPLTENGYLINIKKKNIEIHGKNFKIKYGTEFQVAKSVTYLKKL